MIRSTRNTVISTQVYTEDKLVFLNRIETTKGNLLNAPVDALVNTVNTVGLIGNGLALQFRQTYPQMFRVDEHACKAGEVPVFDMGGLLGGPRWIINFPTKGHWRAGSRKADIETGLQELVDNMAVPNHEHGGQKNRAPARGGLGQP